MSKEIWQKKPFGIHVGCEFICISDAILGGVKSNMSDFRELTGRGRRHFFLVFGFLWNFGQNNFLNPHYCSQIPVDMADTIAIIGFLKTV